MYLIRLDPTSSYSDITLRSLKAAMRSEGMEDIPPGASRGHDPNTGTSRHQQTPADPIRTTANPGVELIQTLASLSLNSEKASSRPLTPDCLESPEISPEVGPT